MPKSYRKKGELKAEVLAYFAKRGDWSMAPLIDGNRHSENAKRWVSEGLLEMRHKGKRVLFRLPQEKKEGGEEEEEQRWGL